MSKYNAKGGHGYGGNIRKARRVQARRSNHAKAIDSCLKAPKAKDIDQWLSAPNRFDLPNVDTNKPQKEAKSYRVSEEYYWENDNASKIFYRLINKDNIDPSITANKKAYKKILEILEKNKIPYHISPNFDPDGRDTPDDSLTVLKSDMKKAEKLTGKYNDILWKTVQ